MSDIYRSWFIEAIEENYLLKLQIKNLTLYVKNLKKLLPKKEKEEDKEPLPLNLTDIFDDM